MPRQAIADDQDPIEAAVNSAVDDQDDDFTIPGEESNDAATQDDAWSSYDSQDGSQTQQRDATPDTRTAQPTQQSDSQRGADATPQRGPQQGQQVDGSGQGTGAGQQQQPEQQQQRQYGQQVKADARGNFVDNEGKIVARAGAERRLFESARRMENDLFNERNRTQQLDQFARQTHQQLQETQRQLQELQQQGPQEPEYIANARKQGMQDNELALGIDIVSQLRTNPIQGARRVLQAAMSNGYNLKDILGTDAQGNVDTSGIDMGAVKNMIDTSLQPITEQQRQQQERDRQQQEGQRAYQQFVTSHPHADVHMDLITDYVQRKPNLSAEGAYYEIKMFAAQNGLDFTKPLQPQVQQMQQQQQQPHQPSVPQSPQPPVPGGNSINANTVTQPHNTPANANDDWDSIIESSLQEAGLQRF